MSISPPQRRPSTEARLIHQNMRVKWKLVEELQPVPVGRGGRFEIYERIGHGAMGVVYRARDTVLDRDVAIKVLTDASASRRDLTRRLLREAKALAALSHPNVLEVFDVDTEDDELFIAMELIEGNTLREWQARRRKFGEVLDAYVAMGRGLAAAHASGLVHRDIKPDNAFVEGEEGNARVVLGDFGLAGGPELRRRLHEWSGEEGEVPETTRGRLGTPAYMAPEQREGNGASAASDQFSFCVCVWEALCGGRPAPMPGVGDFSVLVRPAPIPPWLYRILERGLAAAQDRRFGTLTELLDTIERERRRRADWPMFVVLGVTITLGLGGVAWRLLTGPPLSPSCELADRAIEAHWSPVRKKAIRAAFERLPQSHASPGSDYVVGVLESASQRWRDEAIAQCEEARSGDAGSDLAKREACTVRWLARFGQRVERLEQVDVTLLDHMPAYLAPIQGRVEICQLPPALVSAELAAKLDAAEDAELLEDFDDALTYAEDALTHAERNAEPCIEDQPASLPRAAALFRLGHVQGYGGDAKAGLESLLQARVDAATCGDEALTTDISTATAILLAVDLGEVDRADLLLDEARANLSRVPQAAQGRRAYELAKAEGLVAMRRGKLVGARAYFEQALGFLRVEPNPYLEARLHYNIAQSWFSAEDYVPALKSLRTATQVVAGLGEEHPQALSIEGLTAFTHASVALADGQLAEAAGLLERVINIAEPSLVAKAYSLAIQVAFEQEEFARSYALAVEAVTFARAHPRLAPRTLAELLTIAGAELGERDPAGGVALMREALELWQLHSIESEQQREAQLLLAALLLETDDGEDEARSIVALLLATSWASDTADFRGLLDELVAQLGPSSVATERDRRLPD